MECTTPLENNEPQDIMTFAAILLPSEEYTTSFTHFPCAYSVAEFGRSGNFSLRASVYVKGKLVASIKSPRVNESGYVQIDLNDLLKLTSDNVTGLIVIEYSHPRSIPIELYASHIHKKSGAYIAYPCLSYMGEQLFEWIFEQELDNALFWPGIAITPKSSMQVAVLNPYSSSYGYQLSLFSPQRERWQSSALRIPPMSVKYHNIDELFPDAMQHVYSNSAQCSLCITGQNRILCYAVIKDNETGIVTTLDHFHRYTLL